MMVFQGLLFPGLHGLSWGLMDPSSNATLLIGRLGRGRGVELVGVWYAPSLTAQQQPCPVL